jgi:protein MAK11
MLCAGKYLASASTDDTIGIFDLSKNVELGTISEHSGAVNCLEFYKNTHLLSGSSDRTICLWRTSDWEHLSTMKGHKDEVWSLSVHPTGSLALSTSKDRCAASS